MIRRPPRSTLFPLHDALPILLSPSIDLAPRIITRVAPPTPLALFDILTPATLPFNELTKLASLLRRSEEHTSELQSRQYLVCRLLLEKKKFHTRIFELSLFS